MCEDAFVYHHALFRIKFEFLSKVIAFVARVYVHYDNARFRHKALSTKRSLQRWHEKEQM